MKNAEVAEIHVLYVRVARSFCAIVFGRGQYYSTRTPVGTSTRYVSKHAPIKLGICINVTVKCNNHAGCPSLRRTYCSSQYLVLHSIGRFSRYDTMRQITSGIEAPASQTRDRLHEDLGISTRVGRLKLALAGRPPSGFSVAFCETEPRMSRSKGQEGTAL